MASNLSVSVTADTTDLRTNLALAQADLKKFGAETRQLASAIRAGGDTTGALRGQLQSVAAQFNRAQATVAGLTKNLREAQKASSGLASVVSSLFASFGASAASVARVSSSISSTVASLGAMRAALGPIGGAIAGAFAVQHIIQSTREIAKLGETTENSADILGLSVEQFSRMSGAMQIAGADAESATGIIEKLGHTVLDALKDPAGSAAVALDNLGIKMSTVRAKGNDTEAMLGVVADAWVSHEKGLLRSGAGYEVLGRRMDKILPLLNRGSQGVKELGDAAEKTGSVLSPGMARALAETDDKFDILGQTIRGAGIATLSLFKPLIDHTVDSITAVIRKFTEWANVIESWALKARIAIFNVRNALYQLTHEKGETMVGPRGLIPDEAGAAPAAGTEKVGTKKAGGGGGAGKDDRLSEWKDELNQRLYLLELSNTDMKRLELAWWQDHLATVGEKSKEDIRLRREIGQEIRKLEVELRDSRRKDLEAETSYQQSAYDARAQFQKTYYQGLEALGLLTATQLANIDKELLDEQFQAHREFYDKKLEIFKGNVEEEAKLRREANLDQIKLNTELQAAVDKAAQASRDSWANVFSPLESSFDSAIKGFIQGTTTLYQALLRAGETLFLDPLLKNLTGGLKAAFSAGLGDASGSLVGKFFGGTLLSSLLFERGGIVPSVPSAAGGWMVPQTGSGSVLAQLHANEMVLPRNISEGLQAALGGGGAMTNNRSQAINLTYAPSINAPSHMGLEKMLARDSRAMMGFINTRVRDGALELPGGWRG